MSGTGRHVTMNLATTSVSTATPTIKKKPAVPNLATASAAASTTPGRHVKVSAVPTGKETYSEDYLTRENARLNTLVDKLKNRIECLEEENKKLRSLLHTATRTPQPKHHPAHQKPVSQSTSTSTSTSALPSSVSVSAITPPSATVTVTAPATSPTPTPAPTITVETVPSNTPTPGTSSHKHIKLKLPLEDIRPTTAPLHSAMRTAASARSSVEKHATIVPAPGRVPERETSRKIRPPTPGPPSSRSCRAQAERAKVTGEFVEELEGVEEPHQVQFAESPRGRTLHREDEEEDRQGEITEDLDHFDQPTVSCVENTQEVFQEQEIPEQITDS
ncbi:hypothetical protein Pelo_1140 [Pelomyxa schiedti]|nr:hypothetical protein Pelo_1140 [Pelomyxa schiedti]